MKLKKISFFYILTILITINIVTIAYAKQYTKLDIYKAEQIFNLTLTSIKNKYIKPVNIEKISMIGLNGLKEIDKEVTIANDGNRISYYYKTKPVGSFQKPEKQDELDWSRSIIKAILTLKGRSSKIRNSTPDEIYKPIIKAMLSELDGYSKYITEDENKIEELEGFGGIGIRYRKLGNFLEITEIIPNLPAAEFGLKEKDRILKIENNIITDLSRQEIIHNLRGKNHSNLNITIQRKGTKTSEDITLTRKIITPDTIQYKMDNDCLMIKIISFNKTTSPTLKQLILENKDTINSIIIDIRGNPGGLLDEAVKSANLFLNQGLILSTKGRHKDSFQDYNAKGDDITKNKPIAIIIDGKTASAAEIFAGALLDQQRAITIGTTSFGKGSVQTVIPLPNMSELAITWSNFYTPSGYNLNHLGVMPLICTSRYNNNHVNKIGAIISNIDYKILKQNITKWRDSSTKAEENKNDLREICPAKNQRNLNLAYKIAKVILNNQQLYQKLLEINH